MFVFRCDKDSGVQKESYLLELKAKRFTGLSFKIMGEVWTGYKINKTGCVAMVFEAGC